MWAIRWAAALLLVMLTGCAGILTWKTVYSSASPDRKASLRVEERACFADCALQIAVNRGWSSARIAQKTDCVVFFAHAAWSGSVVAVFVDGVYCGQIRAAYDFASNRVIDFKAAEPWLREAIIRDYGVTAEELKANSGDVFKWATYNNQCCNRAVDDFRKRSPQ
jgi:hypothetical protein